MAKLSEKLARGAASAPFRRGAIAVIGGLCVGLSAWGIGLSWQPRMVPAATAPAQPKPVIIDGPPTDVPPAPAPPPRPARADPFTSVDDEDEGPDGPPPAEAAAETVASPPDGPPDAPPPAARTFDASADTCTALPSPADRLVCASPGLVAADLRLRRLYRRVLDDSADPEAVRDDQRLWDRDRDRVAAIEGPQGLARLYDERIQELSGPG